MNNIQQQVLYNAQARAREYASYSQSKNGLGTTLGGAIGLVVYALNAFVGHTLITVILTFALTLGWLIGKELIRQKLYQPFGKAQEIWPEQSRRKQLRLVAFVTIVMAGIWIFFLRWSFAHNPLAWLITLFALLFLIVTPWIMWRYLRTDDEIILGVYLLIACMVVCVGTNIPSFSSPWSLLGTLLFPLVGLGMLCKGLQEHAAFRVLSTRLGQQTMDRAVEESDHA